ncbi:ABC transporter permease [Cellulomonas sp. URHE0023]|uniref:ABC transporter permease n=1 Tax=Cellulomonas sp. URHE0023 TaxID=1380354 RepID=UPI0005578DAF|nr:ABC transporter permease [Cellulomonas sp. URHE0023]
MTNDNAVREAGLAERESRLSAEPLRSAGPRAGFVTGTWHSVRDVFSHSELLNLLVRRELKARYKDSVLGFFWSLARPLALLLTYYVALGKFLEAERSIPSFAIFVFTGLTAWQLFSDIVINSTSSIVNNSGLIKKVYVPREVFPLSSVGAALFNFWIQILILLAATAAAKQFPTGDRWVYFPLSLAVLVVFGTALGLLLAAINVYLRDVQYLTEILIMILFWLSPIVYSWELVQRALDGTFWEQLYLANPMTLVVLGFQRTFWVAGDGQAYPDDLIARLAITLGVSFVLLWFSQRVFSRLQSNFAQEL